MLSPPISYHELEHSLHNLGASQQQINAWTHKINVPAYTETMAIAKQNWQALNLFLLLTTQWRVEGDKPRGLDYSAIAPTAQLAGITLSTTLFDKIRHMEQITLDIFYAKQAQQRNLAG